MDPTIAPVLVTGATGNVGRAVVRALEMLRAPYVIGATDPERARKALGDEARAVQLDLRDPSTYDEAVRGMRGLFLLRPPAISNVRGTLNQLIDRAVAAGVEHIAFVSVQGAERQRWLPHHAVERHLLSVGVSWTILRPGFFAQNLGDAYRTDICERNELYLPAGAGRVAFVDVRDVGELAARSFVIPTLRRQAWPLTGAEALTFGHVATILSRALGRQIKYRPASVAGYAMHLRTRGLAAAQIAVQTALHVGLRFGNAARMDPALGQLLGRRPRRLAEYVQDHVELWK